MGNVRQATTPGGNEAGTTTAWIDWAVRIFYLHPRAVGLRSHLCLRDCEGSELGWKDVASGRVMVRDPRGPATLVRAILEAAGPPDRPLPADDLPGIALDIPGGAVLAQLRLRSAAILVGKESHQGPDHRLYATFARPGKQTVPLGYVDLATGTPHPCSESASALEPGTSAELLATVEERRPREHHP